jgi:hypothetical protein
VEGIQGSVRQSDSDPRLLELWDPASADERAPSSSMSRAAARAWTIPGELGPCRAVASFPGVAAHFAQRLFVRAGRAAHLFELLIDVAVRLLPTTLRADNGALA